MPVRVPNALHVRAVGSILGRPSTGGHRVVRFVRPVGLTPTERLPLTGHRLERMYNATDPRRHVRYAERAAEQVSLVAQRAQHQVGVLRVDTVHMPLDGLAVLRCVRNGGRLRIFCTILL